MSPNTGHIFVTDGYGNSRVHKYTADGELVLSWGEPGIDAGAVSSGPHNVAVDSDDRVYVADREAHRVQVFDSDGNFITMWNNIHRPDGMALGPDGNIYVGELNGMGGRGRRARPGTQGEHSEPGRRAAGALRRPRRGRGAGQVHRAARHRGGTLAATSTSARWLYTIRGSHMDPPRYPKSLKKLRKLD